MHGYSEYEMQVARRFRELVDARDAEAARAIGKKFLAVGRASRARRVRLLQRVKFFVHVMNGGHFK